MLQIPVLPKQWNTSLHTPQYQLPFPPHIPYKREIPPIFWAVSAELSFTPVAEVVFEVFCSSGSATSFGRFLGSSQGNHHLSSQGSHLLCSQGSHVLCSQGSHVLCSQGSHVNASAYIPLISFF